MVKKLSVLAVLLGLIGLMSWGFYVLTINARAGINGIPDAPDTKAVMEALEHAHFQKAVAARTFDTSGFAEVFVDTDDFAPTESQQSIISNAFGDNAVDSAGYLTYMQAYYSSWEAGAALLDEAAESNLSYEEMENLVTSNQDKIIAPARQDPIGKIVLTYQSISIDRDKAIVLYDSPSAYREAILVKLNGKWFVSSMKILKVHV